ncbi:MAG: hypothetical protein HY689_09215 [Chloroflexi bacterium]|nr:hypothetical protein [Chloroflexota bacterium]
MSAQPQPRQFPSGQVQAMPAAGLQVVPLANAVTAVALVFYVACAALAIVAPEALIGLFQPWLHGLTLEPLRPTGPWFRPGEFAIGLLTFSATFWLGTAAVAWLYNAWSRRQPRYRSAWGAAASRGDAAALSYEGDQHDACARRSMHFSGGVQGVLAASPRTMGRRRGTPGHRPDRSHHGQRRA